MSSIGARVGIALAVSTFLVISAAALPKSISPLAVVLLPGLMASAVFWSEGLHSGMTDTGVWVMFSVMYAVSVTFWTIVAYSALTIVHKWFRTR